VIQAHDRNKKARKETVDEMEKLLADTNAIEREVAEIRR
jgi:hypothetical protein